MTKQNELKKSKITVTVATKNRYDSTLPLCLLSLASQTVLPYEVILIDDNEVKKFYDYPALRHILELFKLKNIKFSYGLPLN